ncbi:3-oxosteroid 1-dehydrogenase [Tessaracoccus bendigoensis DSM 12906]|uniref:3-oxosteroid 1-dehydrogenase n=2 Tax=Tessaracoccus TaxID=72763 RepID=A0A1M6G1T6_9ACTN|nr:3-oxosteroid 1-dehydrogenase [Tessaracoccus bendigoensis DSM 12906]
MAEMFDQTFDVVVVGSGGAAMATALGAVDEHLDVVMLESTDKWGGSTAMSGGGLWLPNNPLMRRERVADSREAALAYMEASIGDVGRSTSRARKEAFVDSVEDFVTTAERYGVEFVRAGEYPDYYPELPGGRIGRAVEVKPLDSKKLGEWYKTLRLTAPLPIKTDDVWLIQRAWSTWSGFKRGAGVVFRMLGFVGTGRRGVGIGAALATAMFVGAVQEGGAKLWLNSPAEELILDGDRVVGVRVTRDGLVQNIGARRGVMLAGGGFDRNTELRQRYHGIDGATSGNPGNVGGAISLGQRAGAALELMDDAWWGASVIGADGADPAFLVGERSLPYSIIVDALGDRFANEAESYVDLGHHMLEHDPDGVYWLIGEARHAHRYLRTYALDPRNNKALADEGSMAKAATLEALARKIGMDPARLQDTVERFNGFARAGVDDDFGRGKSAYDRYYGDPSVVPNPNLGPLEKGPFNAYRIVIGDLGTKGGVLTDEHARALREDGSVIEGLYAAGNNSASVMGRTYPGPGSTIGPAAVFGLRGARHMGGLSAEPVGAGAASVSA